MKETSFSKAISEKANPLRGIDDLDRLINQVKDKKVVMLGESSHGTKEFYEWRAAISKELIKNHGFNFIAIEGDWPPCHEVTKYINHRSSITKPEEVLANFSRWPTWMWANSETANFIDWLQQNSTTKKPIGFYGLDVYSIYESMDSVIKELRKINPALAEQASFYYSCFDSYRHDEKAYARSLFALPEGCKKEVLKALNGALNYHLEATDNNEILFDAVQNAKIVCNAESYYRAMVLGEEDSWNVRDHHMMETLRMLLSHHGFNSKAIVWAHNTHIGDYRATDMVLNGQVNIGGLAREEYGQDNVALIGFTTFSGKVIASTCWDGPIKTMSIPDAVETSIEKEMHDLVPIIGSPNYYILFNDRETYSGLVERRGHRAIGVVYYPPAEHRGNYVPTSLSNRYDAMMFFDRTEALTPLKVAFDRTKIPETYPYGTHI